MENMQFEVLLKKEVLYLFNLCEGAESKVVINLYHRSNVTEPIASTYNAENNRFRRLLEFYSTGTDKYLISVSFERSNLDCAVVVCGMIKENISSYISLPTLE